MGNFKRLRSVDYHRNNDGGSIVRLEINMGHLNPTEMVEKIDNLVSDVEIDNTPSLRRIVERNRCTGTSTFLIQSAIVNPNCCIITRNQQTKRELMRKFQSIIDETPTFYEIYTQNNHAEPNILTLNEIEDQSSFVNLPLLFDTDCFF